MYESINISSYLNVIYASFSGIIPYSTDIHVAIVFALSLSVAYAITLVLSKKKKKSWRIKASKKWLKKFRSNANKFNAHQRFNYIRKVDHFLWEYILLRCFEERGYSIIHTPLTRDGGSDGFVTINGKFIVIQAKRYKGRISKSHVLELNKLVCQNKQYNKGLFIHTGKSSEPILTYFKQNKDLEIISGVSRVLSLLDGLELELFGTRLKRAKNIN